MYRNFDGAGGTFGNTSTSATTTSMAQSGIFASIDSRNPNRVVLVALNRTGSSPTSHFNLAGLGDRWRLASGNWATRCLTGSGSGIQNLARSRLVSGSSFDLNLLGV